MTDRRRLDVEAVAARLELTGVEVVQPLPRCTAPSGSPLNAANSPTPSPLAQSFAQYVSTEAP